MKRAIEVRMTDLGYPAGREDALASYETHAVILAAIETLTGASLLDGETSPAYRLWEEDPESAVAAYIGAHYTAEEGDVLPWGAERLTWDGDSCAWLGV